METIKRLVAARGYMETIKRSVAVRGWRGKGAMNRWRTEDF